VVGPGAPGDHVDSPPMITTSLTVGHIEVVALLDGARELAGPIGDNFPDVPPDELDAFVRVSRCLLHLKTVIFQSVRRSVLSIQESLWIAGERSL
jgi:hypothetical protein